MAQTLDQAIQGGLFNNLPSPRTATWGNWVNGSQFGLPGGVQIPTIGGRRPYPMGSNSFPAFNYQIPHPENFGGDMTNMLDARGQPMAQGDPLQTMAMSGMGSSANWPSYLQQLASGGTINPTLAGMGGGGASKVNYGNPGNPTEGGLQPGQLTGQGSNVVPSNLSGEEKLLDRLFFGSATGQGGGPIANQLFNLGMGRLPPAMQDYITAQTNEQFGHLGARFGTDLGTAIARGLGQAGATQSMNAINSILNLGGTTAGFQFNRGENALQRALQEYIVNKQTDPSNMLLQALLGG